jgi:hypothetical protein
MTTIEHRVWVLERQVKRYRIVILILNVGVVAVLLLMAWFTASTVSDVTEAASYPPGTIRMTRLEIVDGASTRPVCVLRADGGGGRVEVFSRTGTALAGFDGNLGLVVRSADRPAFPK